MMPLPPARTVALRLAVALVLPASAAAQSPVPQPQAETAQLGPVAQVLPFQEVERFLMSMLPPDASEQVRGLQFAKVDDGLAVEAQVRLARIPGMELLGGLGWQRLRAEGDVRMLQPGFAAWEVRGMTLSGIPVPRQVWVTQLQRVTGRADTIVPVPVAAWVRRVEVDTTQLLLY